MRINQNQAIKLSNITFKLKNKQIEAQILIGKYENFLS